MSNSPSNSSIDRAGRALAKGAFSNDAERARHEEILDEYRATHLAPLTETTIQIQRWLSTFSGKYYIAQRLKRKPQIIRKLNRLSVRLVQLQDIAGARVVVKSNAEVDRLHSHLKQHIAESADVELVDARDYRYEGREDSGYRALHLILNADNRSIELQLRSEAQHYWAEQIERTSIIYGHHLKELAGHQDVLQYFHLLSDVFHEIECGRAPSPAHKLSLDQARYQATIIITAADTRNVFDSAVNEGVVKAMIDRQRRSAQGISNWIIVFNWNIGSFVYWDSVDRDPVVAMAQYVEKEKLYPSSEGYEVVMVGSSDASMIRHTHSHYFGIETYDAILESLEDSMVGLARRMPIGLGPLKILQVMIRRKHWTKSKMVARETLKNHFCKSVVGFDDSLAWLIKESLVLSNGSDGAVYLNMQEKRRIESYL